jgi:hypothetical protein
LPFSVAYLGEPGVIETVYTGILSPAEFNQAVTATADAAAEHLSTRFLSDCTGLESGDQSATLDIWALAEFLSSLPPGTFEREALLVPPGTRAGHDIRFYETTCRNRGLDVRIFSSRADALAWLAA